MANSSGALEPQAAFDIQPEIFQGQPCQRLTLPSGDSVLVALQGAHVLSWVAQGRERLFLSERCAFRSSTNAVICLSMALHAMWLGSW